MIKEAVAFFKSESAYKRLFRDFRKKYESLGRIGGNVSIKKYSDDELDVIGGFFGMPGDVLRSGSVVSMVRFEAQLKETRFGEVELKELLDAYFGEVIVSKKDVQAEKIAKYRALLDELCVEYPVLEGWLKFLQGKPVEGRWIVRLAMDDAERFVGMVRWLSDAMTGLPDVAERLPMFSQRITANPHAFDLHTDLGKMFLHVLTVNEGFCEEEEEAVSIPKTTEAVNDLLQRHNIFRDDLLNFVTCAGFYAETDGGEHSVWREAVSNHTVQNVPLRELVSLKRVYPAYGNDVWIVENSGVCSTLLDYEPGIPIISTNGQFKLAALLLLDLLVAEGCILHYAGDFDPEGLGMAQRLLERYPGHAKLWRMSLGDYQKTMPVKELSQVQLEKLKGIGTVELAEVEEEMRELGMAGYQEALVEEMVGDLRNSRTAG
ncbi:TIGR02679 family protein [Virgibacillus sp. DJP39]|uniref:TIGR02679 family protein n=1 Tax=Virgibacillus sp. DJP39 TaxID=3409790 RepID=UPI003BB73DBD